MITLVSAMYTLLKEICVTMHTKPVLTGKSNDYRDTIGTRTCSTEMSNKLLVYQFKYTMQSLFNKSGRIAILSPNLLSNNTNFSGIIFLQCDTYNIHVVALCFLS